MTISTIRPLNRDDCGLLASLHSACFPRGWSAEEFSHMYEHDNVIAFGCYHNETPVGFSFGWLTGGDFELLTIAVLSTFRQQGLATLLLEETCTRAKSHGAHRVFLEVSVNNTAARALYCAFGFELIGQRKHYYRHPDGTLEDALTMHCNI